MNIATIELTEFASAAASSISEIESRVISVYCFKFALGLLFETFVLAAHTTGFNTEEILLNKNSIMPNYQLALLMVSPDNFHTRTCNECGALFIATRKNKLHCNDCTPQKRWNRKSRAKTNHLKNT